MYSTLPDLMPGLPCQDIHRDADGAIIPADPLNIDWQAYQAWLKAGNTPSKPGAPTPASPDATKV